MKNFGIVVTVKNEADTVEDLLQALYRQTVKAHEIIISDGGSTDATLLHVEKWVKKFQKKGTTLKIITQAGNRSEGRNRAIAQATSQVIAVTDAGCIPDTDWLEKITAPFKKDAVDVVAGYYYPIDRKNNEGVDSTFQQCVAPYTSVMADRFNPKNYLPSSRSIAFTKSAWEKVGGYPEYLDTAEDLAFARNLQDAGMKIFVEKKALVYWPQLKTFTQFFLVLFGYAKGDAQARFFRTKVILLFTRYIVFFSVIYVIMTFASNWVSLIFLTMTAYLVWSVLKNYKYVKNPLAIIILPILQLLADCAVMLGTVFGIINQI